MARLNGSTGGRRKTRRAAVAGPQSPAEASFAARRAEVQERLRTLVSRQRERSRQGRHAEAEEAMRERRYLEFVLEVLGAPEPAPSPAARN